MNYLDSILKGGNDTVIRWQRLMWFLKNWLEYNTYATHENFDHLLCVCGSSEFKMHVWLQHWVWMKIEVQVTTIKCCWWKAKPLQYLLWSCVCQYWSIFLHFSNCTSRPDTMILKESTKHFNHYPAPFISGNRYRHSVKHWIPTKRKCV